MKFTIDLGQVSDSAFELIEPGKYLARLVSCEQETSSSGNPMAVWQWQIVGGPHAGKELRSYTSLQEGAQISLKEHLVAFGCDPKSKVTPDTDKYIGRKAYLTVGKSVIKSKRTGEDMEVNRVNAVSAENAANGGKTKASPSPALTMEDDGELPFPL